MSLRENPQGKRYGKTLTGAHFIGGKLKGENAKEKFQSLNPSYLKDVVGEFPIGTAKDVDEACVVARDAFKKWRMVPAPIRGEIVGKIGQIFREQKEMLSRLITREIGKPLRESRGEVQEAIDTCAFFQSEGRRLYGQTVPSELRRKELETYRRPLGVCGLITAGNFPFAVPSWKIIPAILCGNTVVWKPSEDASTVAHAFMNVLRAAGLPDGVVNMVHGTGPVTGAAVIDAIDKGLIQKISFTGSSRVGMKIGEVAGRNLQIPSLELGGKNPMIVMDDADIDAAVNGAVWAAFGTAGQRCTSLGNLILHKKIADKFVSSFVKRAQALVIGDPNLDEGIAYGPMISERFMKGYLEHHKLAKKGKNTKCLLEGRRITEKNAPKNFKGDAKNGLFVTPTIYDGVAIGDALAQTEVFGPTVNVIRVADFDEAIAAANGTKYGLSSAIYTNDPVTRLRFKNEISAGMSSINNSTTGAEAHLPFGGTGWSGNGTRESGVWVVDSYTRWHAVNIDDSGGLQLAQIETEETGEGKAEDLSELVPGA
ncbi:aldehyde dehydrogenase family protein [Candidatus Sumerlaeota bacterium]|nr:aldehyde dehydrogenase family protein [Candidatus Sumerlaeota bacterium]